MAAIDDSWVRERPTARQVRGDVAFACALAVASLAALELLRSAPAGIDLGWRGIEAYLWAVAMALPLAVRRLYPVTVMVVLSVCFYISGDRLPETALSIVIQMCLFIAIYTAWAWARRRRLLTAWSVVIVVAMFAWVAQLLRVADTPATAPGHGVLSPAAAVAIYTVAINAVYFFGAIGWGLVSFRSARQRVELREQAEVLRREQAASARRAVLDERVRIARDLHDVVAHHVSGIGVQAAGANRLLERDPAQSRRALHVIERSSREAVREMHELVGLLRVDDASQRSVERTPRPGLADISGLASDDDGRLQVDYREVGTPFEVPGTVALSAFRAAQEALANVRQHSAATSAHVVLRYLDGDPRSFEVEVLDDGPALPAVPAAGGGFGLRGVAERAQMHHGHSETGPRPDGGFRVRLRVPVEDRP